MSEHQEGTGSDPGRSAPPPVPTRRDGRGEGRASSRKVIAIPRLVGRGRTTLRHFTGLLFGGFLAQVEVKRRRGARGLMFRLQRIMAFFVRWFVDIEIARLPFPAQLRRRMEILGPTYVKLGQILSLRSDILPDVITRELQGLLSRLPEVPFDRIVRIIEEDLGRPLAEMFSEIDPTPLGSASIAQIHRAKTIDGRRVILKVVKPGIRDLLFRDASLLKVVGFVLQWLLPRYQPRRIIEEFFEYTLREVDMNREAENLEIFAANFRHNPEIVFPAAFREYSAERVLCMQFLDGRPPQPELVDSLSMEQRQRLIDLGATAIIQMLYGDGFFHADLHPGNLLVLQDLKIGFIDLGMVGRLDPELRHNLLLLYYSLIMEDYENAARHLSSVSRTEAETDVVGFRRAMKDLCRRWRRAATFEEFSLAQLILESVRLGARYRLYFPVEMVLMVKALVTYEGVGYLLDSEFNVADVSQRHITHIFRQQFSPVRLLREGMRLAPDLMDTVARLPMLVSETLRILERRTRSQPEGPLTGMRSTLFGGFSLVAGAIMVAADAPRPLWIGFLVVGVLLSLRRGKKPSF